MMTTYYKKILFTAMATLVAIAANAYSFSVKDVGGSVNSVVDVSVSMNNETAVSAFECQFVLPEGLMFQKDNNGDFEFTFGSRASRSHYIMSNQTTKGVVKVVSYSAGSTVFTGSDGELFTGKLLLTGKPGTYEVLVNNIVLANSDGTEHQCGSVKFSVTITDSFSFSVSNINGVQNTSIQMPVSLSNASAVSAFNCEIELPEGIDFCKTSGGDIDMSFSGRETNTHTLLCNMLSAKRVKVVSYSSQSKAFTGSDGELFSANLQLNGAPGDYYVTLKNISVASEMGSEYECADVKFKVSIQEPANTDNILSTVDVTAKAGNTVLIPVSLTNDVDVYGVQCDIYLSSDKLSITKDSRGRYVFTQNADRVDGQTASSKLQSDGAVRYMIADYTAENPFAGSDGEMFYISVDIPEGLEGEYSVNIRNITLATDEKKILCPDIVSKITIQSFILGDVDEDGIIDVQDVLRTAQLVLNSSYNIAADMDEDKLIDVQDVIMVAKAVLEQDVVSSASKSAAKAIYKNSLADNISLCSPANGTIDVTLNNKEEYHGFQMDVELPVGYSFTQDANGDAEISINDRKLSDFSVMQKMYSDSKMRILVFNDSQNAIPQNVGELFRFKIKKDNTTIGDVCDVRISNVIFSHDTGKVILSGQVKSFEISDVTGINSVTEKMPKQDVYTVNGKRVKTPIKNSIYIVNGKKSICK